MIVCRGVHKSFRGITALSNVSVTLPDNDITAILGPNGAGKTTLFNIVTGFLRPDGGQCFWRNCEVTGLSPFEISRMGISRTFQDLRLVTQVTVLENLLLACPSPRGERLAGALLHLCVAREDAVNRDKAGQILRLVGLDQKASDLAGELSYGQQKLLAIACCVATESDVLLLDEPVAGVHPAILRDILDLLQTLHSMGKGIIMIEHDLQAVQKIARRAVVLNEGRVIAEGYTTEVLANKDVVEAYLG